MKKWTMILVYIVYAIAVLAIIEGIYKEMYTNGIVTCLGLLWLANWLKQDVDDYDTESN